jgi:hypothetical protein
MESSSFKYKWANCLVNTFNNIKTMAEKFKTHMMYKGSKGVKATTYKKHLELKKKGYTHTKPKK